MLLSATNHSCWPKFVWNLPFQKCIAHTPSISSNNLQLLQLPSISTTPHTHTYTLQFSLETLGFSWFCKSLLHWKGLPWSWKRLAQLVSEKTLALERVSLVLKKASLASLGKDPCPWKRFPWSWEKALEKAQEALEKAHKALEKAQELWKRPRRLWQRPRQALGRQQFHPWQETKISSFAWKKAWLLLLKSCFLTCNLDSKMIIFHIEILI